MDKLHDEWIAGLASPDREVRARSAAGIFAAGRSLALSAAGSWLEHPELQQLLGKEPQVTVGLAVRPETFAAMRAANDWPHLAAVPPDQDASEFTLSTADGVAIDVLTSRETEGAGAIAKYLAKFGEGIQQVEFRCKDVARATQILREALGVSAVYPEVRPGADGTRINFFLAATPQGKKVLIELYEL